MHVRRNSVYEFGYFALFIEGIFLVAHVKHEIIPLLTQLVSQLTKLLHIWLVWELSITFDFTC